MNYDDTKEAESQLEELKKSAPKRGELIECFTLLCRVRPLVRPRWSGHHMYQPKENQKELLFECMQEKTLMIPLPKAISIPMIVDHYVQYAKDSKVESMFPIYNVIGDYDNLSKAINDALVVSKFITNDNLIVGGETLKFYDLSNETIDLCTVFIYKAVLENE